MEIGINTVEKLGEMTPEQLEEIPGIGAEMVEKIQLAVINYYGQYENNEAGPGPGAEVEAEVLTLAPEGIEIESDKMETPGSSGEESAESGPHPVEPVQ
jgi:N utilization substance protein A